MCGILIKLQSFIETTACVNVCIVTTCLVLLIAVGHVLMRMTTAVIVIIQTASIEV